MDSKEVSVFSKFGLEENYLKTIGKIKGVLSFSEEIKKIADMNVTIIKSGLTKEILQKLLEPLPKNLSDLVKSSLEYSVYNAMNFTEDKVIFHSSELLILREEAKKLKFDEKYVLEKKLNECWGSVCNPGSVELSQIGLAMVIETLSNISNESHDKEKNKKWVLFRFRLHQDLD